MLFLTVKITNDKVNIISVVNFYLKVNIFVFFKFYLYSLIFVYRYN